MERKVELAQKESGLEEKLAALAKQRRALLPDAYANILDPLVEHLRAIGIAETTLKVGERLPFFQLPDAPMKCFAEGLWRSAFFGGAGALIAMSPSKPWPRCIPMSWLPVAALLR